MDEQDNSGEDGARQGPGHQEGQAPPQHPQGHQCAPVPPGQQYQPGAQQQYSGRPPYELPPTGGGGMSRRGKIILSVAIVFLVLAGLLVAALVIDRALFPGKKVESFSLESSSVYQEALFNIKQYFYKEYSEAKIKSAAEKADEKQKKKGVTNPDKLLDTGLTALLNALGDQHSGYLTPSANKRLSEDLSGSFFGVGFTLRKDKKLDRPRVVTIIKGSPSERAGVKADDVIMAVDGEDTKGEPLDAVVLRIRGKKGTKVKLKVQRDGKPLEFTITRQKIDIPDFESEIVDGNIGVLRLMEFNDGVSEKVRAAVREMQQKGVKGFILDMRNNPGGLLDESVKTASVFLDDGPVVSYKTKGQKETIEYARGGAETKLPLVVLMNGGSASASEITAGALKDRGRAVLVGSKTYGKGSVQKVFEFSNKGAGKLTIALYYLPNGESIDGKGIQPDVKVEEIKDDPEKTDKLQLDKAKEVINNLIQGKPPTGEVFLLAA